ncbi:MAG: MFS transporter [Actinomycetota bacterium]|nr:MFS transporter [Actinomycetota bacterium]
MTDLRTEPGPRAQAPTTARRSAHKTVLLLLIAGAQLVIALDSTIVNIALPSMGRYFGKGQTDMTWAINAYTLAFGGLLLLGGRAADILGRRQMFIFGLGLFSAGSLLAGVATGYDVLLAGRVVQGLGGAVAAPTALSLITTLFAEGRERNRAFAVYAGVTGGGAAIGLILGGVLTEYLDWRWVLFVNVPIGLALMAGGYLYIHSTERLSGRFDVSGSLMSVAGMVSLVYGFINAANHSWSDTTTVGSLTAGIVLLAVFVQYESRSSIAMMPMRIFAHRSRSGAYLIMLILGAVFFSMFYYLTFFIVGVMGFSSLKSGLAYLPFSAIIIVGSGIVSQALPRVGARAFLTAGATFMTTGLFLFSNVHTDTTYLTGILPAMLITASGVAMVFVTLTVVAVAKVSDTDTGLASALLNVGQQIGGSIGLAVLATAVAGASKREAQSQISSLAGQSQQHLQQLLASAQTGRPAVAGAYADHNALLAFREVLTHGADHGFYVGGIFGIVAVIAAVAIINVRKSEMAALEP